MTTLQRRPGESSYAFKRRQYVQQEAVTFDEFVNAAEVEQTQQPDTPESRESDRIKDEAERLGK